MNPTPEMKARRVLAEAVLADFDAEVADYREGGGRTPDWLSWSYRHAAALRGLARALDAADTPPGGREAFHAAATASSGTAPDGSARLSPPDRLTTLSALTDAAEYRRNHADDGDRQLITAYRSLARSLEDDRQESGR